MGRLQPVEMEADLSGNYVALAKFINALERDDMLFIISSVELGGEQSGPIKLHMKLETYLRRERSETGNGKSEEHDPGGSAGGGGCIAVAYQFIPSSSTIASTANQCESDHSTDSLAHASRGASRRWIE